MVAIDSVTTTWQFALLRLSKHCRVARNTDDAPRPNAGLLGKTIVSSMIQVRSGRARSSMDHQFAHLWQHLLIDHVAWRRMQEL